MVTVSKELQQTLQNAVGEARRRRHEYVTLEHLLHAMTKDKVASEVLLACGADLKVLERELEEYLDRTLESLSASQDPEQTAAFQRVLQRAAWHVQGSGRTELNAGDVLVAITRERGSHAVYLSRSRGSGASTSSSTSPTASGRTARARAGSPGRSLARRARRAR
jgi:ATP-dependent Clp protease ATP-binding subunit ClpA